MSNGSRTKWVVAVAMAAALVVAVAGCGSDGDGSSSTTTTSAASAGGTSLNVTEDGLDAATSQALATAGQTAYGEISAPGAIMAVRTPDGTWAATIGFQDWARTVPVTADLEQRIGSVTKTFTVTALM